MATLLQVFATNSVSHRARGVALRAGTQDGLAQLVRQDVSRLVLATQIAAQLQRRDTLGAVHEDADRGQQIDKGHLAAGKDGAGRGREVLATGSALPLAPGRDEVRLTAAALGAKRLAAVVREADFRERLESLRIAHAIDGFQLERPGVR